MNKQLAAGVGSLLALAGAGIGATALAQPQADAGQPALATAQNTQAVDASVKVANVQGAFAYNQAEADSNAMIKANMGDAAKYLCGANAQLVATDPMDWTLTVSGAVHEPFSATFAELCNTVEVQKTLMGCACAGNPADGRASANALITGIPLCALLDISGVAEGANTIVFASADGYEIALPLSYVSQRYCPIVFAVNDADLAESVGGTNQLWLGATSAKYFARDIVSITLEERQTPPPAPGTDEGNEAYANLPNVGVFYGGTVA